MVHTGLQCCHLSSCCLIPKGVFPCLLGPLELLHGFLLLAQGSKHSGKIAASIPNRRVPAPMQLLSKVDRLAHVLLSLHSLPFIQKDTSKVCVQRPCSLCVCLLTDSFKEIRRLGEDFQSLIHPFASCKQPSATDKEVRDLGVAGPIALLGNSYTVQRIHLCLHAATLQPGQAAGQRCHTPCHGLIVDAVHLFRNICCALEESRSLEKISHCLHRFCGIQDAVKDLLADAAGPQPHRELEGPLCGVHCLFPVACHGQHVAKAGERGRNVTVIDIVVVGSLDDRCLFEERQCVLEAPSAAKHLCQLALRGCQVSDRKEIPSGSIDANRLGELCLSILQPPLLDIDLPQSAQSLCRHRLPGTHIVPADFLDPLVGEGSFLQLAHVFVGRGH
mmetsp:Transcript_29904/g.84314  ORF Transcript_29904/g.84314 Transcript_29904/m.84314 type:complete len:389 (-) Transcript_29904:1312-2478(-)